MYKEHSLFKKPDDENIKIWRYIDFTKFASLLDRQALFFSRADILPDPFEGSYSKANIELRPLIYKELPKDSFNKMQEQMRLFSKEIRKFTLINSWHINEHESAAMWKLYLKSDEGIAIQSTFKHLTESFNKCVEYDIFIGKVNYISYDTEWLPENNIFCPFLYKRKSFEHERELRAIIQDMPFKNGEIDFKKEIFKLGVDIPIDPDILIDKIYISPTSSEWFTDLVKSTINKYGLKKEIIQSSLADGPIY